VSSRLSNSTLSSNCVIFPLDLLFNIMPFAESSCNSRFELSDPAYCAVMLPDLERSLRELIGHHYMMQSASSSRKGDLKEGGKSGRNSY